MDWSNERYVRVYTRDTPEWALLSWEARGFFCLLLRAVDRAGVLSMGKSGHKALAALLRVPLEVVDRAMPELLEDGCIQVHGETVVIPNYIDAQEATQSDKQRQQECRAKRRDLAMRESVTLRDTQSRGATEPSRGVTLQSDLSQPVTSGHSVPCRAVPSVPDLAGASRSAPGQAPPRPEDHVLPAPTSGREDERASPAHQPKRPRKKPEPDELDETPLRRRLSDALCAVYAEVCGCKYPFTGRDAKALGPLLELVGEDVEEAAARFRWALSDAAPWNGGPPPEGRTKFIHRLPAVWAALARAPKPRVSAQAGDLFEGGVVPNGF